MDFRKVYCAYHPTEAITNFCSEKQCLLPLCPICISGHTQFHIQKSNMPRFEAIGESVRKAEESIETRCQEFYNHKSRLLELVSKRENLSKEIIGKLTEAKKNIIEKVETLFEHLIKESLNSVSSKEKEAGLYNNEKICEIYEAVNRQFNSLNQLKPHLRGEKYLTYLIKYLSEEEDAKAQFLKNVQKEIKVNEQYQAAIEIDQNILNQLQTSIRRSARIRFTLPAESLPAKRNPSPQQPKLTLLPSRQPILVRQQSTQQFPNKRSIEQFRMINPACFQPNHQMARPSSSYSNKQHTMQSTDSLFFTRTSTIPSSTIKQNQLSSTMSSKMSESAGKIKERKGLTLHKTLNQITFR